MDRVAITADGRPVEQVTLDSGVLTVRLLTLGASVRDVIAPDGHGRPGPVHLSLPDPADYLERSRNPCLGATVGRYANRIAGARLRLDGRDVALVPNEGPNQLHGGPEGFHRAVWDLVGLRPAGTATAATFALVSPDGDQGYPGRLEATATYALDGDVLTITYTATTDAPTVVNLTNHGYWHLGGEPTVAGHRLAVTGSAVLPVDRAGIPTGSLEPVAGTPFDLRVGVVLGEVLSGPLGGLDHCYSVDGPPALLRDAAVLSAPATGRWLKVRTDQPGLQVYTGNGLGEPFTRHGAVCLEAQRFPDTPHHPDLGTAVLTPGREYRSVTELTFGTGEPPPVREGGLSASRPASSTAAPPS